MNKQINLSFFSDEWKEVKTHKKEFPEQIERIMPWDHAVGRAGGAGQTVLL